MWRLHKPFLPGLIPFMLINIGCSSFGHSQENGFTYAEIPITKESAKAGQGHSIQFRGDSLQLSGQGIHEGDSLRSAHVTKGDLSLLDIVKTKGKVRIINIVPSLDTSVCEQQTHYLSEKNRGLDEKAVLITISVDTPFAQGRFAKDAQIDNILFLSGLSGWGNLANPMDCFSKTHIF